MDDRARVWNWRPSPVVEYVLVVWGVGFFVFVVCLVGVFLKAEPELDKTVFRE